MLHFHKLNLRQRILFGYAVPLFLTVIAAGGVVLNAKKLEAHSRATEKGWLVVRDSDRLELLLHKRQAMIRAYLLTRTEAFANNYEETVSEYDQLIASLTNSIHASDSEQKNRLVELQKLGQTGFELNLRLMSLVKAGQMKEAIAEFSKGKILSTVERSSTLLQQLNATEEKRQIVREQEAEKALQSLIAATVIGSISATVLALVMGAVIATRIAQTINETVNAIASSSSEIAATTEQHERMANQQAASVNQTSITMDELNASSRQTAEQAEEATAGARAIAAQVMRLSEQTKQIASITNLVSNLANQTNMLALNAAVEAARAGDSGKGFAVVATAIRQLADQSQKSVEKINTIIADIQAITDATFLETENGTKVESIVAAVNSIVVSSQQISLSAKQQAVAISQVVGAMNALNEGAVQTACGISQTKIGVQKLNEAALTLKTAV